MADSVRVPSDSISCCFRLRRRKNKREEDLISSLPDVILQHILFFIETKFAIRTSVLSKRWRHEAASTNKTLTQYTALKMMSFHLKTDMENNVPYINKWIEFAMSRKAESISLDFSFQSEYKIADSFYIYSSVKELSLQSYFVHMMPKWVVSWTSLKKLSMRCCCLQSIANILSGCPVLEWPRHIVAPQIHCLRMINSEMPCTLVDVSSLNEAKMDISFVPVKWNFEKVFPRVINLVVEMLEKLQNVENLTFGGNYLQILSLAEVSDVEGQNFDS
ncbi:PREDICTED: putative F-box protein At1g57690 [Camelina sativa]|uniref:F-box protein At1g57690 n=1 Tax=Camelina sativa TaxID=90675 RepID=A0ABM0T0G3_CAMSA|nr:PREDICTED: putative F-box protein At1g57690 [Camelina sativa]